MARNARASLPKMTLVRPPWPACQVETPGSIAVAGVFDPDVRRVTLARVALAELSARHTDDRPGDPVSIVLPDGIPADRRRNVVRQSDLIELEDRRMNCGGR